MTTDRTAEAAALPTHVDADGKRSVVVPSDLFDEMFAAYSDRTDDKAGQAVADIHGMKRILVEDMPVLKASDLDIVGKLFGLRFVDGCSNGCVELYIEDDENWHYKMRFDRSWLADLAKLAGIYSTQPDREDAEIFRWLTTDHDVPETRIKCRDLIERLPVMSYSAARRDILTAIDRARKEKE